MRPQELRAGGNKFFSSLSPSATGVQAWSPTPHSNARGRRFFLLHIYCHHKHHTLLTMQHVCRYAIFQPTTHTAAAAAREHHIVPAS
eukprot:2828816-Rhodomonas_salina.1